MRKRTGEAGDPCGRPLAIGFGFSIWLLKEKPSFLLDRKELAHLVR